MLGSGLQYDVTDIESASVLQGLSSAGKHLFGHAFPVCSTDAAFHLINCSRNLDCKQRRKSLKNYDKNPFENFKRNVFLYPSTLFNVPDKQEMFIIKLKEKNNHECKKLPLLKYIIHIPTGTFYWWGKSILLPCLPRYIADRFISAL